MTFLATLDSPTWRQIRPSRVHADGLGDVDTCDVRMLFCLWRHHQRQLCSADSLKTGPAINIIAVFLGLLIFNGMGSSPEPESVEFRCRLSSMLAVPSSREWSLIRVDQHRAPIFRIVREYPRAKSELRAHQMARKLRRAGFTPRKIGAELSSNGSQLELPTAGLTPHFHAELL